MNSNTHCGGAEGEVEGLSRLHNNENINTTNRRQEAGTGGALCQQQQQQQQCQAKIQAAYKCGM